MPDQNENLRFNLKHVFVLVALLAAALSAGRITGSPAMSIHLTLLVVGWIMYQFMHARLAGLVPCLLGLDYLTITGIHWTYFARDSNFLINGIFNTFASFLIFAGIAAFFVCFSNRKRPYWEWQLINAIAFLAVLVVWWLVVPYFGEAAVAQRRARDTANNNAAMAESVAQVEAICQKLSRVPSAQEFKDLLKERLPHVRDDSFETEIHYNYINDHQYRLWYIIGWGDTYNYDSAQPKKGWYYEPF
jgi:hypothetical protein